jgi:hypothetical protein
MDLDRYRLTVSRVFIGLLWLLVPLLSALAATGHADVWAVAAAAAALATAASVAALLGASQAWPRLVIAAAATGAAVLFVYAGGGQWQVDYHEAFIALIATLAAFADWRPIAFAAVLMPLQHMADDPTRLIVQVAFIASEAIFLIWLTSRRRRGFY